MGGMKGHPQSNCGGGGGGGGGGGWMRMKMKMKKKKMAMVAVVILVGVMGVMVVQKVRDRRLFNILIKDKDRQILSLHLLLQKERQYAKETKRKNQDLNTKLYSLRAQKTELNNKNLEMRSTITSMRDEQRALELAIDEKHNEIKQKESQINDLRSSLQTSPKIWSVSSDDPSVREVNLTDKVTTTKLTEHREKGLWFGMSRSGQKPNYQQSVVEGNREIINPNVDVLKSREEDHKGDVDTDSGNLASVWEHDARDLSVDHKDNVKIEMHNTTSGRLPATDTGVSEENRDGLSLKGRSYIGASESQRDRSDQYTMGLITQTNGQTDKSQVKANQEEGPTEVKGFKSRNYPTNEVHRVTKREMGKRSIDQETKSEAHRKDEDEAETEVDVSMESSNGSEADQDYKEETEE